jgi:hypothetical protein
MLKPKQKQKITITIHSTKIILYLNDSKLGEYEDATLTQPKKDFQLLQRSGRVFFDNIKITEKN